MYLVRIETLRQHQAQTLKPTGPPARKLLIKKKNQDAGHIAGTVFKKLLAG
jgi:hypothetical protein